ncbi:tryptophan halogenase [Sphingomonas sp. PP-F2F-A104-K0414]|uniref:tryptophan 7-halogenase n=1 Tax=Sphingomonas sp. PP-F2F-A104-K0414 TaxID=2135661 RepID=UPI0010E72444|nr:tryptophan 7-halogenase [Sphingomonas sp. PP-F2F-A104-K0414]TCQ00820.1 tryptophan halogenase [Sphingomonas sp. PP-F2F-A104-K0414]
MTSRTPIASIAVLGAGVVGLSAAIAFARALPGLAVTLIETPDDAAALTDRLSGTLPSITAFHDRIGLRERDLLAAGATHRLGTRLSDWSADGAPVVLAQGERGGTIAPGAFHQHWLNARRAGKTAAFDAFSVPAVLAAAEKFVHPSDDPNSPISGFGYALRLDPPRYRDLLRALARHIGIVPVPGAFAGVERGEDGRVSAVLLADGRRLVADLYVDCSGPAAPLRSALDTQWDDWRTWLPVDRLLLGTAPVQTLTPTDDLVAVPAGWRFASRLRDRTLVGLAYAADQTSDSSARRILPAGDTIVPLTPGARPEPWKHNVLALGDAAVVLDPLADANLHLAHAAILRAIDLLPGRDCAPTELAEYNQRSYRQAARVRDFQAAHYLPTGRTRGPFWKHASRLSRPDSLAHTLEHFAHRGRLPFYEDESFDKDDWHGLLLGLGIIPRIADPIASASPPDTIAATLKRLAEATAALPARLPPYPLYLAQLERAR